MLGESASVRVSAPFMLRDGHHEEDSSMEGNMFVPFNQMQLPTPIKGARWIPTFDDPNYFETLLPEEIYDSFFTIRRMGFIANRIIRKLCETRHMVCSKILEKRKKLRALQRKSFEQLTPAGVQYLKVLLKLEIAALKNNAKSVEAELSPSPNIKARLAHLAADQGAMEILKKVYTSDGNARTLEFWKYLANDCVNNPQWVPRRVLDERLYDVDPSFPPEEKISPEILRSIFSRLRVDYSNAVLKFISVHNSAKTNSTQEALDSDFWERYAKHDKGLFYIYMLFKGRTDCFLVDMSLARTDFELEIENALSSYNTSAVVNGPMVGAKRNVAQMSGSSHQSHHDDDLMLLDAADHMHGNDMGAVPVYRRDPMMGPVDDEVWQCTVRKDRAISNYYMRLSINNDVKFYLDLLTKESTGETVKRNIRNTINTLLLKKVEDRYDDL